MNRGLIAKAFRESWPGTLCFATALAVAESVLSYVLMDFRDQLSFIWTQVSFVKPVLRGLVGAEVADQVGPELLLSLPWVHPVALALLWGHAIVHCTRVPAGEVDRGTIDVLLGLPVSRGEIYRSEGLVWVGSTLAIVLLGAAGNSLGLRMLGQGTMIDAWRVGILAANLLCLSFAVGGMVWFASATCDRRGRAVGAALAVVLASFLLNYLAQFWKPADRVSFLSILQYYRPLAILRSGLWPVRDIVVLLAVGLSLWLSGGVVFRRRDMATV